MGLFDENPYGTSSVGTGKGEVAEESKREEIKMEVEQPKPA
jgi:hypothetical protein